jgi:hypothetical protein
MFIRLNKIGLLALCAVLTVGGVHAMKLTKSSSLEGELQVPASVASISGKRLEIRVFARSGAVADRPAKQVGALDIAKFKHTQGTASKRHFAVQLNAARDDALSYYATFFIVDGAKRTHIGECAHRPGDLCSVWSKDDPAELSVSFRAIE